MKNFIYILFLCLISCQEKQSRNIENQPELTSMSVEVAHDSFENISANFEKEIENWNELNVLKNFMTRFKKASPKSVLSNAVELKGLVKSLKESQKSILFQNPSFETRVNILYNESLRLADMNTIPAITAKEVNTQIDKIINAFSAINTKINTSFLKKKFEDEIDFDVSFIGLDSTKIDTISKKSINKILDTKPLKK